MTFGAKTVTAFFVVFYLLPLLGNAWFGDQVVTIYHVAPLTSYSLFLMAAVFGLFVAFGELQGGSVLPEAVRHSLTRSLTRLGTAYRSVRAGIIVVWFPVMLEHLVSGQSGYRYSHISLSESGSTTALVGIVFNLVATADLFCCMFALPRHAVKLGGRRHLENASLATLLLLTANGTASMLFALFAAAYGFFPDLYYRLMFRKQRRLTAGGVLRFVFIFAAAAMLFGGSWLVGEMIKLSSSVNADVATSWHRLRHIITEAGFMGDYGLYLISAISSYYYSLLFTAYVPPEALDGSLWSPIAHPLASLTYRLDVLVGGELQVPRPEFGSLSRLNYALLTNEAVISLRQGSSPGPIASFNYVFAFPLNVIFCAIYLRWVASVIDGLMVVHQGESLSLVGYLLLLVQGLLFFQSPFDFLTLFDDATARVAIIVGTSVCTRARVTRPGFR